MYAYYCFEYVIQLLCSLNRPFQLKTMFVTLQDGIFRYKWNFSEVSLDKRLDLFETNWAFFAGFGNQRCLMCACPFVLFGYLLLKKWHYFDILYLLIGCSVLYIFEGQSKFSHDSFSSLVLMKMFAFWCWILYYVCFYHALTWDIFNILFNFQATLVFCLFSFSPLSLALGLCLCSFHWYVSFSLVVISTVYIDRFIHHVNNFHCSLCQNVKCSHDLIKMYYLSTSIVVVDAAWNITLKNCLFSSCFFVVPTGDQQYTCFSLCWQQQVQGLKNYYYCQIQKNGKHLCWEEGFPYFMEPISYRKFHLVYLCLSGAMIW